MKRLLLISILLLTACQESATSASSLSGAGEQLQNVSDRNAVLYQNILEKKASFDQILEVFKSHDKQVLSNNIAALKRYGSDKKVVAVLESIWDEDVSSHPEFSCRGFGFVELQRDLFFREPSKYKGLLRITSEKSRKPVDTRISCDLLKLIGGTCYKCRYVPQDHQT